MGQLNVSFDDALLAEIDRLAAQRGINRPELLRALVREAIGAEGTRIADQPRLVIDSTHRLEQAVTRNSGAKLSALDILENPAAVHLPETVREPIQGRQIKQAEQVERDQQRLSRDTLRIPLDMRRAAEASLPVAQIVNRPEKSLDLSL